MREWKLEDWTVESLASALTHMHKDNAIISIPTFQRGKKWDESERKAFIDSLQKGFPIGVMLFYETHENNKTTYVLVDGLQRSDCIKRYMSNPTDFFDNRNIPDEFCHKVLEILNVDTVSGNYGIVRSTLLKFIQNKGEFSVQFYDPACELYQHFYPDKAIPQLSELINTLDRFFQSWQKRHDELKLTNIPIIIYYGSRDNLSEIFHRINSKGTQLTQYELYAATWSQEVRFTVKNTDIVEFVIRKYDSYIHDGFTVYNYDPALMRSSRKLNAFEYLFGLSKFLVNKYSILAFEPKNAQPDSVNSLGFELVNACLNDSDKIEHLDQDINKMSDVNAFEAELCAAIDFVDDSIRQFTYFKGNQRSSRRMLHSKFQMLSMISSTFKAMHKSDDSKDSWEKIKNSLVKNLRSYYVYDILMDTWHSGSSKSLYSLSKRYFSELPVRSWRTALDRFFDKSMERKETQKIESPKNKEYIFLNCVYLQAFTAMDQLSISSFDVEHIATKEQMKKLIETCQGSGLPVSCVANLCYLPEYANRSKKGKNFYQDEKYRQRVSIPEIERKYSFTKEKDLEWMDLPYTNGADDFEYLRDAYTTFCTNRFAKMKYLFCESMGIDYHAMNAALAEEQIALNLDDSFTDISTSGFYDICLSRVQDMIQTPLIKVKRHTYKTPDNKKGYSIHVHQFPSFLERLPNKSLKIQPDMDKFATFQGDKTSAIFLRV